MIKNVLVIYNPTSGTKSNKSMLYKLFNYYSLNKINYELIETKYKNHAQDLCEDSDLSHYHDIIIWIINVMNNIIIDILVHILNLISIIIMF